MSRNLMTFAIEPEAVTLCRECYAEGQTAQRTAEHLTNLGIMQDYWAALSFARREFFYAKARRAPWVEQLLSGSALAVKVRHYVSFADMVDSLKF